MTEFCTQVHGRKSYQITVKTDNKEHYLRIQQAARECVDNAPTVDAVPVVHGHWVIEKTATGSEYTRCSKCGLDFSWNDRKYGLHKLDMRGCDFCPACGAKMDGVSE